MESLQIRINQFKNKCVDQRHVSTSDYNKDEVNLLLMQ